MVVTYRLTGRKIGGYASSWVTGKVMHSLQVDNDLVSDQDYGQLVSCLRNHFHVALVVIVDVILKCHEQ